MVVNDYACYLDKRGGLESIASELAPTGNVAPIGHLTFPNIGCLITHPRALD